MNQDIRWNFIKECRQLASMLYGDSIFVEIPKRIELNGNLNIIKDNKKIDEISYSSSVTPEYKIIKINSKNKPDNTTSISFPKNTEKTASIEFPLVKLGGIRSKNIIEGNSNVNNKLASIIAYHSSGIKENISDESVEKWLESNDFGSERKDSVVSELKTLGIGIFAKKRGHYQTGEKVRINNPNSMEHNEQGTVLKRKRHKDTFYYLVLVDGSSAPVWCFEKFLRKTMV